MINVAGVEINLCRDRMEQKGQVIVCREIISTLELCLNNYYPETAKQAVILDLKAQI